jgi:hypothetical protein
MKKIILVLTLLAVLTMPVMALAQISTSPPTINTDLEGLGEKIVSAVWIVFTVIVIIMFVIAGILFLTAQGNPEKVSLARMAFLWGVVGVVVGILAYTMITVVTSIF